MKIQGAMAILPLVAMSMAIPLYVIKPMCILVLMFMTMLIFFITVEFIIMRGFMGMKNYPVVHVFIAMPRFMIMRLLGKVYGNASMGYHTDGYSSVYGNARIKRHSDLYSVPINFEVYESNNVIKIDKQNK